LSIFSTKWTVSWDVNVVKISNLGHTYFNTNVTSQKKISSYISKFCGNADPKV